MSGFLASALGQWGVNRQINSFKKEINDTFGGSEEKVYLDDAPDVAYNKDDHQSFTAKRAEAAKLRSQQNVKSDAVRQAMERRAKAAAAKGRK